MSNRCQSNVFCNLGHSPFQIKSLMCGDALLIPVMVCYMFSAKSLPLLSSGPMMFESKDNFLFHENACKMFVISFVPKLWTPLVMKPEYSRITSSIPVLLMPWLLLPSSRQHPWYWSCRISRSLSSMRKDLNYLHQLRWRNDRKRKYILIFLERNSEGYGLLVVWRENCVITPVMCVFVICLFSAA